MPGLTQVDIAFVSPKLDLSKNLDLAVPGTYHVGRPVVRIVSFDRIVEIINSKQRVRRMTIRGSDGLGYEFCLKGHEDIRQDERVMQLFGLANAPRCGHCQLQETPPHPALFRHSVGTRC